MEDLNFKKFTISIWASYTSVRKDIGDDFEKTMADFSAEITELQYKSTKPGGISWMSAAMLMLIPDDNIILQSDKDDEAELHRMIKAVIGWNILQKPEMEDAIKEIM